MIISKIDDPDSMAANALRVLDLGIPVIKIKGSREYEKDIQRIKAVRKAVQFRMGMVLDLI
jgi:L-alanine-DL-glutamate epimerase-like enolase superfamily enzyme